MCFLNEFLDADESIQKAYTCANRALGVLIAKAKAAHGFPLSVFSRLFDACVIPICTYSAHIWAHGKRQPRVKVNDELSEWFDINCGVKQGCVLSPTLFSMFINDLVGDIHNSGKGVQCGTYTFTSLLYADDLVIIADKEEDLQAMLNNVSTGSCNGCLGWGCFWKLYSHLNGMVHMNVLTPLYDVANYIVLAIRIMSAGDCFKVMGTCGLN